MTAQTIMQAVFLECGIDATAEVGGADFQARQVLEFMNAAGEDAARRGEWSRLIKTVQIGANELSFDLPTDFQEMVETGAVRLTATPYAPVRTIVSPEQWDFLQVTPTAQAYCHIRDGKLLLTNNPAGATLTYLSKNWAGDAKSAITTNNDEPLIPERLIERGAIWRFKRQKGLPYDDILAEYEADLEADYMADRGA